MNGSYYLKANVVAEPLVDGWYAWAHLIPPATLSRNMTERHLRIIDSYLESPETHEAAVKDPRLLGGPFMDLSQISGDDRPFVLSTPRLEGGDSLHLQIPFASERLDTLFRMKHEPSSESAIADALGLEDQDEARFRSFLTTESPRPYDGYDGHGARWRYFGHACILLETRGVSVLLDPVLSYTYESDISRYTYKDIPTVTDYD